MSKIKLKDDIDLSFITKYELGNEILNHWEILLHEIFKILHQKEVFSIFTFGSIVRGNFSYNDNIPQRTCSDYELNVVINKEKKILDNLTSKFLEISKNLEKTFYPKSILFHIDIRCFPVNQYKNNENLICYLPYHILFGKSPFNQVELNFEIESETLIELLIKKVFGLTLAITYPPFTTEFKYLLAKFIIYYETEFRKHFKLQPLIEQQVLQEIHNFKKRIMSNLDDKEWAKLYSIYFNFIKKSGQLIDERLIEYQNSIVSACVDLLEQRRKGIDSRKLLRKLLNEFLQSFYPSIHPQRHYYLKIYNMLN